MKKILAVLLALCSMAALLCSCGSSKNVWTLSDGTQLKSPLTIDGEEIDFDDFRNWYLSIKAQMESDDEKIDWESEDNQKLLIDTTIDDIKNTMAIERIAKKYNITLSEEELSEIDDAMRQTFEGAGGAESYKTLLSENFFTHEIYEKRQKINALYEKLQTELVGEDSKANKIVVTFDEAAKEFSKKYYRFACISFPVDVYDSNGQEVDEKTFEIRKAAALKKANEAYAKLKNATFTEVQKQYLEEGKTEDNQDYYKVDELSAVLEKDMSGVEIGQYTAPMYSQAAYYVFYRMENDNVYLKQNGKATVISNYASQKILELIEVETDSLKVEKSKDFSKITTKTLV